MINLLTEVTLQGSIIVTLSSETSQFSWEGTVETTDVTPLAQFERVETPVAEAVSFDMSIYKADQDWEREIFQGQWGILYVYAEGKIVGKQVMAFQALIEKVSENYPDHEKVEKEISGQRQNGWVIAPNSIYRG